MKDCLEAWALGCGVRVDFCLDPAAGPWHDLTAYSGIVVARENRTDPPSSGAVWATRMHEEAISGFVDKGGALVVLHAGLASYPQAGPWFDTVRGAFLYHPPEHPSFSVRRAGAEHPALSRFAAFEATDEMYFVKIDSARTTPLLEAWSPDYGSSCASWAHEQGRGKVFCLTPGHRAEVTADSAYRRTLDAGLRWALGLG